MRPSGAQSQDWAVIQTSDDAGDDHDGEHEDGECPAGSLSSPLAPTKENRLKTRRAVEREKL